MLADEFSDGRTDMMLDWFAPGSVNEPFRGTIDFSSVAYEMKMA